MNNRPPWSDIELAHYKSNAKRTIPRIAKLAKAHRVVVQAGGHRGSWPLFLARYFEQVYTFEAHERNFRDLQAIVPANVIAHHAALGDMNSFVTVMPGIRLTTGGFYVQRGGRVNTPGCVHMLTVDDLKLDVLDALVLDIEGAEFPALKGAEQTIQRCKPLIVVERNLPFGARFGYDFEELEAWVQALGYKPRKKLIGKDVFYEASSADGRGECERGSTRVTSGAGTLGHE